MSIKLDQIEAFVRVAEMGGLSSAARLSGNAKSRVSRQLNELEDTLGVKLMRRSNTGITLTEEGMTFLESAKRIMLEVEAAREISGLKMVEPCGTVRITMPQTYGIQFFSPILPEFLHKYPRINVQVDLSSHSRNLLEEGFDLAIRMGDPVEHFVAQKLFDSRLVLVASPAYLAKLEIPKEPEDLNAHSMIMSGRNSLLSTVELNKGNRKYTVKAEPRLSANDPAFLIPHAEQGCGIAVLPTMLIGRQLADGSLVQVLPEWRGPMIPGNLIFPQEHNRPSRVRVLANFIVEKLRHSVD